MCCFQFNIVEGLFACLYLIFHRDFQWKCSLFLFNSFNYVWYVVLVIFVFFYAFLCLFFKPTLNKNQKSTDCTPVVLSNRNAILNKRRKHVRILIPRIILGQQQLQQPTLMQTMHNISKTTTTITTTITPTTTTIKKVLNTKWPIELEFFFDFLLLKRRKFSFCFVVANSLV